MTRSRRYNLLCPIARALDAVGDRWSLLILRDLHAGPARFQELQEGLGIATNLLTTRLADLIDSGLIRKVDAGGHREYELTDLGQQTDRLLFELANFGLLTARGSDTREPGNLRTIALPLRMALAAHPNRPTLSARLVVDDEPFVITSTPDSVDVSYGDATTDVDITAATDYHAMLDLAEGLLTTDAFATEHFDVVAGNTHIDSLRDLLAPLGILPPQPETPDP